MKNGNATGPLGLVSELGESEEELEISMLMSDSHFQKKLPGLLHWKPFKYEEERFLFHLKGSFRSQDIEVFHVEKAAWLER